MVLLQKVHKYFQELKAHGQEIQDIHKAIQEYVAINEDLRRQLGEIKPICSYELMPYQADLAKLKEDELAEYLTRVINESSAINKEVVALTQSSTPTPKAAPIASNDKGDVVVAKKPVHKQVTNGETSSNIVQQPQGTPIHGDSVGAGAFEFTTAIATYSHENANKDVAIHEGTMEEDDSEPDEAPAMVPGAWSPSPGANRGCSTSTTATATCTHENANEDEAVHEGIVEDDDSEPDEAPAMVEGANRGCSMSGEAHAQPMGSGSDVLQCLSQRHDVNTMIKAGGVEKAKGNTAGGVEKAKGILPNTMIKAGGVEKAKGNTAGGVEKAKGILPNSAKTAAKSPIFTKSFSSLFGQTQKVSNVSMTKHSILSSSAGKKPNSTWVQSFSSNPRSETKLQFQDHGEARKTRKLRLPTALAHKANEWTSCLVGHFVAEHPPFSLVNSLAFMHWQHKGLQEVLCNEDGFFFFKFDSLENSTNVIEGGPWDFSGQPIFLRKWRRNLNLKKETKSKLPIWVKFYNLPLEYWSKEGLGWIGSMIGNPLFPDSMTDSCKRISFARMFIEIDIDSDLPNEFEIEVLNDEGEVETIPIKVEYKWKPPKCLKCKCFGHDCLAKTPSPPVHIAARNPKNQPISKMEWVQVQGKGKGNIISDGSVAPHHNSLHENPSSSKGQSTELASSSKRSPSNNFTILNSVMEETVRPCDPMGIDGTSPHDHEDKVQMEDDSSDNFEDNSSLEAYDDHPVVHSPTTLNKSGSSRKKKKNKKKKRRH